MNNGVTRRDFLDGMALAIAAGLAPRDVLADLHPLAAYPPALTGLRGQHDGSFEAAHTLAFDHKQFRVGGLRVAEQYDCVVVGGGISGLAAAWFYRQRYGANARILVLDNHDDFGGHARRNEFTSGDRLLIGYGGSEALQSPKANFSPVVNELMKQLGVDVDRFRLHFAQTLYPGFGLSRASFFDRDRFGADKLVKGDPTDWVADDIPPERRNGRPLAEFIGDFPISEPSRSQLLELFTSGRGTLGTSPTMRRARLISRKRPTSTSCARTGACRTTRSRTSAAARSISSVGRRRRSPRSNADCSGIPGLPAARCRRMQAPLRTWTSRTSITSRTATRPSRGCWCAAWCRRRCPGARWTTSCSRKPITTNWIERSTGCGSA